MKISWAGCVVVLIGEQTHSRPWVDWEIKEAERQGKRIVGVWAQGARDSDVPASLEKLGGPVVGWQSGLIIDAIDGKIDDWEKPDGTQWYQRNIPRVRCHQ